MRERRSGKISALVFSSSLALLALPCGSAAGQASAVALQADRTNPQFGGRVDLNVLPVSVLDGDGLPVGGLSPEDFIVLEDGVEQEVALLLSPQDAPLEIALLIDVNDSMENFHNMEGRVRSSVVDLLDQLADDDCVYLLRYRETLGRGHWGRPRDPAIRKAIDDPPMEGGTALRDAVAEGLFRLEFEPERCAPTSLSPASGQGVRRKRRALVVVADGEDRHSFLPIDELLSIARQSEAPILSVGLDHLALPQPILDKALSDYELLVAVMGIAPEVAKVFVGDAAAALTVTNLQALATASGGHFVRGGGSLGRLSDAFTEALRWLRSYYLVGYYVNMPDTAQGGSELPTWHDIDVRTNRPGLRVEARAGYFRTPVDEIAASLRVESALEQIARGNIEGAMIELDTALEADPYSWEARYQRGRILLRGGKPEVALQELLAAAELSPGRGDVHELACRVSLQLDDYPTAWEQAIRAHQAEVNVTEELLLLREKTAEPADLEERLNAPRIFVDFVGELNPVKNAALRGVSIILAQRLAEVREIGLIDLEALADYRILIGLEESSDSSPPQLEISLEVWESESAGGELIYRRAVAFSNMERREGVKAELEPITTDLLEWLNEHRRD